MLSNNKILMFAAVVAFSNMAVSAEQSNLRRRNHRRLRGGIHHDNSVAKKQNDIGQGLEEDVEFFTNLVRRAQDMSTPLQPPTLPPVVVDPTPTPTDDGGGGVMPPSDNTSPTYSPVLDPTDPPVSPAPTELPTSPSPTAAPVSEPAPTPPPVAEFTCPDPEVVGCTAVDPNDFEDECDTLGEPCENGNPGEFCCPDGCPRNYCTAKMAPSSFGDFVKMMAPSSISDFVPLLALPQDEIISTLEEIEEEKEDV